MSAETIVKLLLDADDAESAKDFIKRQAEKKRKAEAEKEKYLPLGTVSHGTLREDHLINAFISAIRRVDPKEAAFLSKNFSELIGDGDPNEDDPEEIQYEKQRFLETLFDQLNGYCPPYTHFGAHEGDASDFGVWVSNEALEEAVEQGEVEEINALDPRYSAFYHDHIWPPKDTLHDAKYVLFRHTGLYSYALYKSKCSTPVRKALWST